MRTAETVLSIIRERGQRGLHLERLYQQLYNRSLYLRAYSRLYANKGAMTPGATSETVDGMSLTKIDKIIDTLKQECYRWTPVQRTYIPKSNGKQRALGMPSWSDKLLQEVIRSLLEAYYEPQFSDHSHGFRQGRGCHTALQEIAQKWRGTKWFIEGDICSCFDSIEHTILVDVLCKSIHDNRFIRLISNLLKAGYLEEWHYNTTYSGVPQGGVLSPILMNLVLDRLDKFVEQNLIAAYTSGRRRKTYPPYVALTKSAWKARKEGNLDAARLLSQQAQTIPSRDPNDPDFRRLRYVRYADDFLLGFTGPKSEANDIKYKIAAFLQEQLRLELSEEKTLITNARSETAHFLGYEVQTLHANDKHDYRGQRCINGSIGLRVPEQVIKEHCSKYMRHGKPTHMAQRINDSVYSIIAQYQIEYRGVVQYYRMAYNLHRFHRLKRVMEESLTKTLANKLKTTRSKIYKRFGSNHENEYGIYRVLEITVDRGLDKKPLVASFGGIPLQWNKWVAIGETLTEPIWSSMRSEVIERLLAQECELCGARNGIEVHHIRKLADLKRSGRDGQRWMQVMAARSRKTLIVCQSCHNNIHYGRYDGTALSKQVTGELRETEIAHA